MSVRWFDSIVKNVGDDTIQITWVALPQDDEVHVTVDSVDGRIVVSIDQKAPPANSDALGNDRVMEITFDGPVSAKDVTVVLSRLAHPLAPTPRPGPPVRGVVVPGPQQLTGRAFGCDAAYVETDVYSRLATTTSFGYVEFGPSDVYIHSRSAVAPAAGCTFRTWRRTSVI